MTRIELVMKKEKMSGRRAKLRIETRWCPDVFGIDCTCAKNCKECWNTKVEEEK